MAGGNEGRNSNVQREPGRTAINSEPQMDTNEHQLFLKKEVFQVVGCAMEVLNTLLSLLQNSDLHLASHGFPPGSAGVPPTLWHNSYPSMVSPWERGRPARILVKALPRRQSAGEPTNPVKPIATTLPSLVRARRPRSQGSQPFPAINPTYWRILQKALLIISSVHNLNGRG